MTNTKLEQLKAHLAEEIDMKYLLYHSLKTIEHIHGTEYVNELKEVLPQHKDTLNNLTQELKDTIMSTTFEESTVIEDKPTTFGFSESPIEVYTDGACSNNQSETNEGGWGWVAVSHDEVLIESYGSEKNTSNNRMELMAAIEALKSCYKIEETNLKLYTDSAYVLNGITNWIHGWVQKGWVNSKKQPVKNKDLWIELHELNQSMNVEWIKVKGHSGNKWNEYVDDLAVKGAAEYLS